MAHCISGSAARILISDLVALARESNALALELASHPNNEADSEYHYGRRDVWTAVVAMVKEAAGISDD